MANIYNLLTFFLIKQVSWIRHRDLHLLTVGKETYTPDGRFQSVHNPHTDDWALKVWTKILHFTLLLKRWKMYDFNRKHLVTNFLPVFKELWRWFRHKIHFLLAFTVFSPSQTLPNVKFFIKIYLESFLFVPYFSVHSFFCFLSAKHFLMLP